MSKMKEEVRALLQLEGEQCCIAFPASFSGFEGHFPDHPIVPAIVQVMTAQVAIEERTGMTHRIKRLKNAKFLDKLSVDQQVDLTCKQKSEGVYSARIQMQDKLISSFTLELD